MKVKEFVEHINSIGYDDNTEIHFGSIINMKCYRKFEIESIEEEKFNSNQNAIAIDFDDRTVLSKEEIDRDLEAQGILLRLPVPIGHTCYLVGEAECEVCPYLNDEEYSCSTCPEGILECELDYLIFNRLSDIYETREEAEKVWNSRIKG